MTGAPRRKFPEEDLLGETARIHPGKVTKPAKTMALQKLTDVCWESDSLCNLLAGEPVLPLCRAGYTKDDTTARVMEDVKPPQVCLLQCPGLGIAVSTMAVNTSLFVRIDRGLYKEMGIRKEPKTRDALASCTATSPSSEPLSSSDHRGR